MKALARFLSVLSLTAFCVACGGYSGDGTPAVSTTPPPALPPPPPDPLTVGDYTVFQLDLPSGHSRAQANRINDNGHIVGWSGFDQSAVLWTGDATGAITGQELGTLPGGKFSIAYGINNLGQVVGLTDGASGSRRPFIWTANDGMRDLGVPVGLVGGSAHSINDAGQVVGVFLNSEEGGANLVGSFGIWTVDADGNVLDQRNLGNLGGVAALALDNNAHGNVAGDIWFDGSQTGFFWSEADGVVEINNTDEGLGINDNDAVVGVGNGHDDAGYVLTTGGGLVEVPEGILMDINVAGQAVGRSNVNETLQQAFIWENGDVKLLPMPENRDFSWGLSINEAGWIVGWSTDVDGNEYANLWRPVQP